MGIPVTTPNTKLRPKTRVQKSAIRASSTRREWSAMAFMTTSSSASPIVSCGNR
jgi:hypothetical protein